MKKATHRMFRPGALSKNLLKTWSAACNGFYVLPPGIDNPLCDYGSDDTDNFPESINTVVDGTSIDSEILSGVCHLWVKNGVYDEDLTLDIDGMHLYLEPGTELDNTTSSGNITVTGDNVTIELGSGVTIDGTIEFQGLHGQVICHNGVTIGGQLQSTFSGDYLFMDGGGLSGTISNVNMESAYCHLHDTNVESASGDAILVTNDIGKCVIEGCKVTDSAGYGINVSDVETLVIGCHIEDATSGGMKLAAQENILVGNSVVLTGSSNGIDITNRGDDSVVVGNVIEVDTGNTIDLEASADDCVIVGNRLDGTINDLAGTSTVIANDTEAL